MGVDVRGDEFQPDGNRSSETEFVLAVFPQQIDEDVLSPVDGQDILGDGLGIIGIGAHERTFREEHDDQKNFEQQPIAV